jgi:hypothetical protein
MSRLVAFGCSYTWGQGLEDCPIGSSTPSMFAWPTILANTLNLEVVNKGAAGSSNLEILLRILNGDFKQTDIVIVLWTWSHRDLIFTTDYITNSWKYKKISNTCFKRITPWLDENTGSTDFKEFLKIHSAHDLAIKSCLHIHHAIMYLDSLGIKHYHFIIENLVTPDFIKLNANHINFDFSNPIDFANDNLHPGIESQNQIAKQIHDSINQK